VNQQGTVLLACYPDDHLTDLNQTPFFFGLNVTTRPGFEPAEARHQQGRPANQAVSQQGRLQAIDQVNTTEIHKYNFAWGKFILFRA
jgi:hypothetical protein